MPALKRITYAEMKVLILILSVVSISLANAASTACTDFNTQTRIARDAVKSLIALAAVPKVINYFGGATTVNGVTVVNVQAHYEESKDWYKVTVRNSDCRVTDVTLLQENLPLE